jgi:hypothetical protein
MARTPTDRLGLSKPDVDEPYDVSIEFGTNLDKIDAAVGFHECTSSTRPTGSDKWPGMAIRETDTGKCYVLDEDDTNWRQIAVNTGTSVPIDDDVSITGTLAVSSTMSTGNPQVNYQVFTSDGTWTKPAGAKTVIVECLGGGGAGGGAPATAAGQASAGAGGQAGGYAKSVFAASALSVTEAVDVGAGGAGASATTGGNGADSTFAASTGNEVRGAGGNGGGFLAASNTFGVTPVATVTQTNVGNFSARGMPGGWGIRNGPDAAGAAGFGGNGPWGGGAPATGNATGATAPANSGAGGAGSSNNASGAAKAGGNGGTGVVIVTSMFG